MVILRTVQQCLAEIKKLDPNTAVSEHVIRSLCKYNKIDWHKIGCKWMISLESLFNYLNNNFGERIDEEKQ